MEYISDFPSQQAEEFQKYLLELDEQGKLKEEFLSRYQSNMGEENSLANYIDKHWNEDGKKLFIEYTGIETFDDKQTIKRAGIKLNEVTYGSKRYFLWKCSTCQYEWIAMIVNRTSKVLKNNCPACTNKVAVKGKNDLETFCKQHSEFSHLLAEFVGEDIDGNKILPSEISRASNKNVLWHCSNKGCNYEWYSMIANRTCKNARGCPKCGRLRTIEASHSRGETLNVWCNRHGLYGAKLKSEFVGLDKNNKLIKIDKISRGSSKSVQWKCSKCHKLWLAKPSDRTSRDRTGCPHCAANAWTSFPEQYIFNCLKQVFTKVLNRAKTKDTHYEYDIAIPELTLCIEYSGYRWHKDKIDRDKIKEAYCKSKGINFMQIYAHNGDIIEPDTYTKEKIIYQVADNKSQHILQLQQIIKFILKEYNSEALYDTIDFELAEQQANKVMGKA